MSLFGIKAVITTIHSLKELTQAKSVWVFMLTIQFGPDIVGIKKFECFHGFKVIYMLFRHLCDFQQSQFVFKINESTTLGGKNINVYWAYVIRGNYLIVCTLTSARVLSVTSITNSTGWAERSSPTNLLSIAKSTVAPKLSIFERKQYSRPSSMNFLSRPELRKVS